MYSRPEGWEKRDKRVLRVIGLLIQWLVPIKSRKRKIIRCDTDREIFETAKADFVIRELIRVAIEMDIASGARNTNAPNNTAIQF